MDDALRQLSNRLAARAPGPPLGGQDLNRLLLWAVRLTGASYGYLGIPGTELNHPKPSLVSVPEEPWPGVKISFKACALLAAHSSGGPVVFDDFPPRAASSPSGPAEEPQMGTRITVGIGAAWVRKGGRPVLYFPPTGRFLAAPLKGQGRYAGLILDGHSARFGRKASTRIARLLALVNKAGGPLPSPEQVLGDEEPAGELPVLEWEGRRLSLADPLTVGQDPTCEITVQDGLTSRRHAVLVHLSNDKVMLIDLRSSNGTFVNGERVETRILEPGDVVHTVKRNWTLHFRRVADLGGDDPLPPERCRIGFDLADEGATLLLEAVGRWGGDAETRTAAFLELIGCQLDLSELTLVWTVADKLRFSGVELGHQGWQPCRSLPATVVSCLPQLDDPTPSARDGSVVVPLSIETSGARLVAVARHHSEEPPNLNGLAAALEKGFGPGGLPLEDEARLAALRARGETVSSGQECASLVRDAYAAGFVQEAVELGRTLAPRFLDADEVERAAAEIEAQLPA